MKRNTPFSKGSFSRSTIAATLGALVWLGLNLAPDRATCGPATNGPGLAVSGAPAKSAPIPMDQIGAVAGKQYRGDGLSVAATSEGARLRCVFQKLEGEATTEGLWLRSTREGSQGERFRVVAAGVGRQPSSVKSDMGIAMLPESDPAPSGAAWADGAASWWNMPLLTELETTLLAPSYRYGAPNGAVSSLMSEGQTLARVGTVSVADQVVRFVRPGLTEEYSVSMDGVRQDFVVRERPPGAGPLRVELDVTGAKAEPRADGARLTLDGSGRKIAYNRLRATDATGRELTARMEVGRALRCAPAEVAESRASQPSSDACGAHGVRALPVKLVVVVDDADALYPVRIDPTFSDDRWVSMGALPGPDSEVFAAVVDGSGNLYIGGGFSVVGDVIANHIAKWDGSSWSALGAGMGDWYHYPLVAALAVSGSDLYVGGEFTRAGGSPADYVARWHGSSWSALGSGLNDWVNALAVTNGELYVGGDFLTAGGKVSPYVAKALIGEP